MASSKVSTSEEEVESRDEAGDSPLLDSATATVKKMIAQGKERGYVTYDELNGALPPGQVSSEQIEDTMAMLSEMGINVIDGEESEEALERFNVLRRRVERRAGDKASLGEFDSPSGHGNAA